ncbi:MAG: hypothetical protein AB7V50_02420 [Vampirovibrionia bacterium]
MKKYFQGSSLVQYCIIISLIAIALTPVFLMLGGNLLSIFTGYNNTFGDIAEQAKDNVPKIPYDSTSDITQGELEADCSGSECVFKAGNLTIQGIPDDFSSLVETTGVSSGTDVLASILDQIVEQLEATTLTEETSKIKQLAILGHQLAQDEYEMSTYQCTDSQSYCVFSVNPELVTLDNDFRTSLSSFESQLNTVLDSISTNQELSAIIQQPSNEIMSLANSLTSSIDSDKYSCHYVFTNIIDGYNNISTVTDVDSAIICASGHGEDNGYTCE